MPLPIIIKDHPNQPLLGTEMGSTVTTRGIYEKMKLELMFQTKTLRSMVGKQSRNLVEIAQKMIIGLEVLFGLDLIIEANQPLQMAKHKFAFWNFGCLWFPKKYLLLL
jgi:hypothetical protein